MKIETLCLPEAVTGPLLRLANVNGDKLQISWRQTTAARIPNGRMASAVTAKAANDYHFKTGQRK